MVDAETTHRIGTAIVQLVELENAANDDVAAAKNETETLARAHARAAFVLTLTEAGTATFVADLKRRREALAALIVASPSEENNTRLQELLQLPKLPVYSLSPTKTSEKPLRNAAAAPLAQLSEPRHNPVPRPTKQPPSGLDSLDAAAHLDYLTVCSCVVYDAEKNEWIELRCGICGSNYSTRTKSYYMIGIPAMVAHMASRHQQNMTYAQSLHKCRFRAIRRKELDEIISGEVQIELVGAPDSVALPARGAEELAQQTSTSNAEQKKQESIGREVVQREEGNIAS
ncbi:hypothetical protein CKM354_000468400 [Cercospora kikuchii]|uniref:Uncharacterized protein n=1 Tax=Cercospora kikuchii TaxID=84275 RepID=A0A9P3CEM2_9PEZI|nr:uncharacterized protein CKM354_000468400 [Cercospora kikuchii]GIZ41378.1 hypothetical protein CKM354_000468400 [Cercospora kikuchii]